MANDSPDWVEQSSPNLAATVTVLAGQTQGSPASWSYQASNTCLLFNVLEGGGATGVNPIELIVSTIDGVTLLDVTWPNAPNNGGPVLLPYAIGALGVPIVTVKMGAAAAADGVVCNIYALDVPPGGWAWAPTQQPVPVTIVNPP